MISLIFVHQMKCKDYSVKQTAHSIASGIKQWLICSIVSREESGGGLHLMGYTHGERGKIASWESAWDYVALLRGVWLDKMYETKGYIHLGEFIMIDNFQ